MHKLDIEVDIQGAYFCRPGERLKVLAFTDERCSGLAVHRGMNPQSLGYDWTVTHIESGQPLLEGEGSIEQALARALYMSLFTDCSQPIEVLRQHKALSEYIIETRHNRIRKRSIVDRFICRAIKAIGPCHFQNRDEWRRQFIEWINTKAPERDEFWDVFASLGLGQYTDSLLAAGKLSTYMHEDGGRCYSEFFGEVEGEEEIFRSHFASYCTFGKTAVGRL